MRKHEKVVLTFATMAVFISTSLFLPRLINAGNLEPSGPPTSGTMHTLDEIYNKLQDIRGPQGEQGPQGPQGPSGPTGPPGADGSLETLGCSEGQSIVWNGFEWACSGSGLSMLDPPPRTKGKFTVSISGSTQEQDWWEINGGGLIFHPGTTEGQISTPDLWEWENITLSGSVDNGVLNSNFKVGIGETEDVSATSVQIDTLRFPPIPIESPKPRYKAYEPGPPEPLNVTIIATPNEVVLQSFFVPWFKAAAAEGMDARKDMTLESYDSSKEVVYKIQFIGCFPIHFSYHSSSYLSGSSEPSTLVDLVMSVDRIGAISNERNKDFSDWLKDMIMETNYRRHLVCKYYNLSGEIVDQIDYTDCFITEYKFPWFNAFAADEALQETFIIKPGFSPNIFE